MTDLLECRRCGQPKPDGEFPVDRRNGRRRQRASWCRVCTREYNRTRYKPSETTRAANARYYEKHHLSVRERQVGHRLQYRYGLTIEQYDEMFEAQGGVCAICKKPPKKLRLCVDHNHETGEVRGLLCHPCNRAFGYFENDEWREAAEMYMAEARVVV